MALLGLVAVPIACAVGYRLGQNPRGEKAPQQGWLESRGPVVPHDSFPSECSLCHIGRTWHLIKDDFQFEHAKETGVPLTGAHEKAECLRCHNDRGPAGVFHRRGCVGCHGDVHEGQLGRHCESCHGDINWLAKEAIVQHNRTRFALIGAHAAAACFRCHPGAAAKNFKRADTSCESCHQEELGKAKDPDHLAQGWTRDCQRCHRPVTWVGANFLHVFFPLFGMHASTDCMSCHAGGVYKGIARDCRGCHLPAFNATQNPRHLASGFSTACDSCHVVNGWSPVHYAHKQFDGPHGFPCATCHTNYATFLQFNCLDCHAHEQNRMQGKHAGTSGYQYASSACFSCHPNGRG